MGPLCFTVLGAVLLAGCAANGPDPPDAAPDAGAGDARATACNATIGATNGAPCSGGATCTYPITCGSFEQVATCACEGGRFRCGDGVGALDADAAPRCVDLAHASTTPCGASLRTTAGRACDTIGAACFFPGATCDSREGVAVLDYCACTKSDIGELRFACVVVPCPPA